MGDEKTFLTINGVRYMPIADHKRPPTGTLMGIAHMDCADGTRKTFLEFQDLTGGCDAAWIGTGTRVALVILPREADQNAEALDIARKMFR